MKLVIDANELFSALVSHGRGRTTKKVELLYSAAVELYAPSLLFDELRRNKREIMAKSGLSGGDFDRLLALFQSRIKPVPESELRAKLREADAICPDPDDTAYFAAALHLGCPIWSGEEKLKRQKRVPVLNTRELVEQHGL